MSLHRPVRRGVSGVSLQIEILKNPGIDFYSGFRKKIIKGGVQIDILKKIQV